MQQSEWVVDGTPRVPSSKSSKSKTTNKLPHFIEVKVTSAMDENTRVWYERFNTMRNRLLELGEMESK